MSKIQKYFGTKAYYKSVLAIALPIMLQNGITNLVSLLDNVMIGVVGDQQMSGASIANQLLFVFNLCVFGALSGIGIFTAQFFGKKDDKGVRSTFQMKLVTSIAIVILAIAIFLLFGDQLILSYLQGEGTEENALQIFEYGKSYLRIMLFSLPLYALTQVYASTMREAENAAMPMHAGVIAVLVNLVFNYIFIYGKLGLPALGVDGAAYATVLSRIVELAYVVIRTHMLAGKYSFIPGLYHFTKMPEGLIGKVFRQGFPLMINEALWSAGMAFLNQCYSYTSQMVVPAINICSTLWNVMSVTFMAFGISVGIITGHDLGAGDFEKAKDDARKLMTLSFIISIFVALITTALSFVFPKIYNTTDEIRNLATALIIASCIFMPMDSISHSSYFILRAGGKTWITFIFDSMFVWAVFIPIAYLLAHYTGLPAPTIRFFVEATLILKASMGLFFVKKGVWINNLVENE